MALTNYQTLTAALLQAPSSPVPLIPAATLTTYINQARLQVAAQGACVRQYLDLTLVANTAKYGFAALTGFDAGVGGVYHIRQLWYQLPGTSGTLWVPSRPFEYLSLFGQMNTPVLGAVGAPEMWAQFGQGETGNLFVDPLPDQSYAAFVDALGVPILLVDDSTVEAIPAIWTLAVPFYAAWLAFQSMQRQSDADMNLKRFQEQMMLARNAANPDLIMENWSQAADPESGNRLGAAPAARATG